ncbi:histidine phosphatase family protein [Micropruina sp.]|uniref:histidine phosphatase family protein n=1 Tax=Micropruina sp. TaxID=2737536 RepID=UPI0039E32E72
MRLLLARHGRTASNVAALLDTAPPGPGLDEFGRAQARRLVDRLAHHELDAVYSSHLTRAVQTAEPTAAARGLSPAVLPGLREIGAGDDERSADLRRYFAVLRSWGEGDATARIPGGESGVEFIARYTAAVRQIAESGHQVALLVSHGAAIRTWAGYVMPQLHAALGSFGIPNTTVIIADGDPDAGWTLAGIDYPDPDPDDGFGLNGVVAAQ